MLVEGPENFAQKLKMIQENMSFLRKKVFYNKVFDWAARNNQFLPTAEKL